VCAGTRRLPAEGFWKLRFSDNTEAIEDGAPVREPDLSAGDLIPGDCARGWVIFEVPAGARPVRLDYGPPLGVPGGGAGTTVRFQVA
jgi:hypothetical protein